MFKSLITSLVHDKLKIDHTMSNHLALVTIANSNLINEDWVYEEDDKEIYVDDIYDESNDIEGNA